MKEKIDYFLKKLNTLPRCKIDEYYRWADYIELKCLTNKDGFYSQNDFTDDIVQPYEDLGEGDLEDLQNTKKLTKPEKKDKWDQIAKDSFRVIESRVNLFDEYYPYSLTENNLAINFKKDISINEKLYLFLLLCSNLRYTIKFKKELTGCFEKACKEVVEKILPNNSEVHLFGSSNTENQSTRWKSAKLWDKLIWLSEFLGEEVRVEEKEISKYDTGDRGIDIVGKTFLGDKLSSFPIYFAQCACSPKEWPVKQASIKGDKWDRLISLATYPNYLMFIPQSFRDSTGDWHDRTNIHKTIMFDRYRILKNFINKTRFNKFSSYKIIEEIISNKASIF